ncbi:tetratricopeptide repeat protein [Chloroflexi bacterium TSY]|nr:tetratricopeptide repeat protein [Chloroflexi bacterium TSY]
MGDTHGIGKTYNNLGLVYSRQGDAERAETLWREALTRLHPDSPEYQELQERLQEGD